MNSKHAVQKLTRIGIRLVPVLALVVWAIPLLQYGGISTPSHSSHRSKSSKVVVEEVTSAQEELKVKQEIEHFEPILLVSSDRYPKPKSSPFVLDSIECCKKILCHDVLSRGPPRC